MKVDSHYLEINPHKIQTSPNGLEYRVINLERDGTKEPVWDNQRKMMRSCWIVTIKFIENGRKVKFHFDNQDKCIKKEKI